MRSNGGWSWARGCSVLRVFARSCPEPAPSCRRAGSDAADAPLVRFCTNPVAYVVVLPALHQEREGRGTRCVSDARRDQKPTMSARQSDILRLSRAAAKGHPAQERCSGPRKSPVGGVGANDDAPGRLRYILFRLTTVARPPRTVSSAPRGRSHQRRGNPADWLPSWRGRRPYRKT